MAEGLQQVVFLHLCAVVHLDVLVVDGTVGQGYLVEVDENLFRGIGGNEGHAAVVTGGDLTVLAAVVIQHDGRIAHTVGLRLGGHDDHSRIGHGRCCALLQGQSLGMLLGAYLGDGHLCSSADGGCLVDIARQGKTVLAVLEGVVESDGVSVTVDRGIFAHKTAAVAVGSVAGI